MLYCDAGRLPGPGSAGGWANQGAALWRHAWRMRCLVQGWVPPSSFLWRLFVTHGPARRAHSSPTPEMLRRARAHPAGRNENSRQQREARGSQKCYRACKGVFSKNKMPAEGV